MLKILAKISVVIIALLFSIAILIDYIDPEPSWTQKLTLTIKTPNGEYSSSSLARAEQYRAGIIGNAIRYSEGLSLALKLPNQKYLFILLGNPLQMVYSTFYTHVKQSKGGNDLSEYEFYQYVPDINIQLPIPRKNYPLFVTFDDINDPTSIKLVNPDELSATLGQGYKFQSLKLEITGEKIDYTKIQQIAPWLNGYSHQPLFDGECANCNNTTKELLQQLDKSDFRRMAG